MANPFSGIISSEFKQLFNNMIDALLEDRALVRPCLLVYDDNSQIECPNCVVDSMLKTSTNVYKTGGPLQFSSGQICPYCNGNGIILGEDTEEIKIAVIYDMQTMRKFSSVQYPQGSILTVSAISFLDKFKQAKYLVTNTDLEDSVKLRYKRAQEPEPVGFGAADYCFGVWSKV